jgi:hypothetical protein
MRPFDHDSFDREFEKDWRAARRLGWLAGGVALLFYAVIIVAAILAINKWLI